MSFSTLQFYIMILRLQSNVSNSFLSPVQCLSITLRLQIPCTLTCTLIPYTLTHYVRLVLFEVRCLLRRCGDVLRIIYDADKNILKDSFCSIDKKINKPYIEVSWINMPKQKRIVITDKFLLAHQKPLSRLEEVWDSRAQPKNPCSIDSWCNCFAMHL